MPCNITSCSVNVRRLCDIMQRDTRYQLVLVSRSVSHLKWNCVHVCICIYIYIERERERDIIHIKRLSDSESATGKVPKKYRERGCLKYGEDNIIIIRLLAKS